MSERSKGMTSDEIQRKLAFQRGLLSLMKRTTPLYAPMIEKAMDDIDDIMEKVITIR